MEEHKMSNDEMIDYLKSTGLYEEDEIISLDDIKEMLEDKNSVIPIKDLVRRFIEIDEYFRDMRDITEWNIRQILINIALFQN